MVPKNVVLFISLILSCHSRGIGDPAHILAYRVDQERGRWIWTFDYCGAKRRPETKVMDIRIRYAETGSEPICSTIDEKIYPNVWPHGEGLLARDGSPCHLGPGRYYLYARPDFGGTDFEITPSGEMRVLGEQCFVPNDK